MVTIPTLEDMLAAGVHFGHKVSRWHPKMEPYLYGERNGVHVIHLEKTQEALAAVLPAVKQMAAEGKVILFATTKPQGGAVVREAAVASGMPYLVGRWVGGLLTNFSEIKTLIKTYISLRDSQAAGEFDQYTKKEQLDLKRKLEKMDATLSGLVTLTSMPDALFLPAFQRDKTAATEAIRTHVPIIGICDSNANCTKADYVIPGNDDAVRSIVLLVGLVRDAILEGKKERGTSNE